MAVVLEPAMQQIEFQTGEPHRFVETRRPQKALTHQGERNQAEDLVGLVESVARWLRRSRACTPGKGNSSRSKGLVR